MKKEILDTPFQDSFSDFLEKGEKILWKDNSLLPAYAVVPSNQKYWNFNLRYGMKMFIYFSVMILCFSLRQYIDERIMLLVMVLGMAIIIYTMPRKTTSKIFTEYAITAKQILFKSNFSKNKKFFFISFSEIKNCIVVENKNNRGTIFLAVENPELIPFDTYTLDDDGIKERRHQPTLESIENPHEVAKLIRQGIQNNR